MMPTSTAGEIIRRRRSRLRCAYPLLIASGRPWQAASERARRGIPDLATEPSPSLQDALLAQLPASPDAYPQKLDLVREAVARHPVRRRRLPRRELPRRPDPRPGHARGLASRSTASPRPRGALDRRAARSISSSTPGHVGSTLVSRLLDETGARAVAARAAAAADARRSPRRAGPSGLAAERRAVRRRSRRVHDAVEPRLRRDAQRRRQGDEQRRPDRRGAVSNGTQARGRSTSTWAPNPIWPRCSRGRIRRSTCAGTDPSASGACSRG